MSWLASKIAFLKRHTELVLRSSTCNRRGNDTRSLVFEDLENRLLLTADFLRTNGAVGTNTEALAGIGHGTPVDDSLEQSTFDTGTVLAHSDAGAALMRGNSPFAIADSMASATALCPTPINAATVIPTTNTAGSFIDAALGGDLVEGETTWHLEPSAQNFAIDNNAIAGGNFTFEQTDEIQYVFHGVLYVGAHGGSVASGYASAGASVQVSSQIVVGQVTAVVGATLNNDGTWDIAGSIPGVGAFTEPGVASLNNYYQFTVNIAANTQVFMESGFGAGVWAGAYGAGSSAEIQVHPLTATWAYVTSENQNLTAGDFNADGIVNASDYRLWTQNDLRADADMDGDVDSDDFDIWAANATDVKIVSTESDELDTDYTYGDLSLREALATAGSDTIIFAPSVHDIVLSYDGADVGSTPDQLSATGIYVLGPGADQLTIDGNNQTRVFELTDSTIEAVTITGGNSANDGGGILSSNLTVRESRITGNSASGGGGGITNLGTLHLLDSEVSDNYAGFGGGLELQSNLSGYTIEIRNSTISGNQAGAAYGHGGGISAYLFDNGGPGTDFTITNSTISGNSARIGGGGISFWYYSPYGPLSSPPLINNTIIAGNTNFASGPSDVEGNGFDSSSGHNLIGYDPLGIFSSGTGNIRGTSSAIDPHLAALDFYGGKTRTMALLSNSLAIDSGDNAFVDDEEIDRDQRGEYYLRVVDWDLDTDAVVDIGAFELAISELYT